jgi:hypothetical protein
MIATDGVISVALTPILLIMPSVPVPPDLLELPRGPVTATRSETRREQDHEIRLQN